MTKSSGLIQIVGFIKEAAAIVHYFSILAIILSTYNLTFDGGNAGVILAWFIVALLSAAIAELLKSRMPTLLRIIMHRRKT